MMIISCSFLTMAEYGSSEPMFGSLTVVLHRFDFVLGFIA